jgi:phytoene desaturase
MLHLRPQNKLQGFDNLYLVGGGTHPGSGLPTIFLSAQISTRMLCEVTGKQFAGASQRVREIGVKREMQAV